MLSAKLPMTAYHTQLSHARARGEWRFRGMKSGSPADAERPLSVSKAVALLPQNDPGMQFAFTYGH